MPNKICTSCHQLQPLEAFNRRLSAKDGHQARCRECCRAWYRRNQVEHKQNVRFRNLLTLRLYRERLTDYLLTHPCVDCGEGDVRVLEFDHREGVDKLSEVALLVSALHAWHRVEAEMEKCDIRCANCHRRKTAERGNHWRHQWWLQSQAPKQRSTAAS